MRFFLQEDVQSNAAFGAANQISDENATFPVLALNNYSLLSVLMLKRHQDVLLRLTIGLYCAARLCQLVADHLPILLTAVFHVLPPALFAFLHGRALYRARGFAVFAASCLGVGALSESLSLRTGIPFGSYFFTGVMGPRLFNLPLLLVLAYLGIAYCSWVLALLILGIAGRRLSTRDLVFVPLLASSVFLAWDLSMEADWSTIDRAWIWRQGGFYYGVPLSNFVGWFITAWTFFQLFAVYARKHPPARSVAFPGFWRYAVALYGVCAAGNLLIPLVPMAPPVVLDATGKAWYTQTILLSDNAVSIFIMGAFATVAWYRSTQAQLSRDLPCGAVVCSRLRYRSDKGIPQ